MLERASHRQIELPQGYIWPTGAPEQTGEVDDCSIEEQCARDWNLFTTSSITLSVDGQELADWHQRPHGDPVYRMRSTM